MLKIRLRRAGEPAKGRHQFKVVVMESKKARDSKFIEQVGYYDPPRSIFKLEIDRYQDWIKKGAQPTQTVVSLFKKYKKSIAKNKSGEILDK